MIRSGHNGEQNEGALYLGGEDPLIGRILNGRFRLTEKIGSGGMGVVYKATQLALDRVVAVKVLNPASPEVEEQFRKRFVLEASLPSKLRHPNTISIIDHGATEDGLMYIAMEYLDGETLSRMLAREGAIHWTRAVHIGQQVARSIREAHKAGLIHRDLKPANIMLLHDGEGEKDRVKVLDFGLVKNTGTSASTPSREVTQASLLIGSPSYMAPEQARNCPDARSDIYSLGVIFYRMLTGKLPFRAADSIEILFKHFKESAVPIRTVRPDLNIPSEIEAVVMRCLEKDPSARPQSMDELLELLRQAIPTGHSDIIRSPPISGPLNVAPEDLSGVSVSFAREAPNDAGEAATAFMDVDVEPAPAQAKRGLSVVQIAAGVGIAVGILAVAAIYSLRTDTPADMPPVPVAPAPATATSDPKPAPTQPPSGEEPKDSEAEARPPRSIAKDLTPSAPPAATSSSARTLRFHINSTPEDADVYWDGKLVGRTPTVLALAPNKRGIAEARLTLSLDGYRSVTFIASGAEQDLNFSRKLQKEASTNRSESSGSSAREINIPAGYKEDPYR